MVDTVLQHEDAYLAEAQRLSHTGSFGWDPERAALRWSAETFRIFEYDPFVTPTVEHVLGRVHPEDLMLVEQAIARAMLNPTDLELDHRLLMPDGRVKHVHVVARWMAADSGAPEMIGAVMDVSEARRAAAELSRSEAYLQQAERLTHTGTWAHRIGHSDALYVSEETCRILGVDPALRSRYTATLMRERMHPADLPRLDAMMIEAVRTRSPYNVSHRIVRPDGAVRFVHTLGTPVTNAAGEVVELVGTVIDVTERRRAERAVRRARERALRTRFDAILEERNRLAREIHDTLLQGVTGVALQLAAAARRIAGPPEAVSALADVVALAQRTIADARRAVWDLRTPAPAGGDFSSNLERIVTDATRGAGLAASYDPKGDPVPLRPEVETAITRVVQEAIANTAQHAQARSVRVGLSYRRQGVRVAIVDDGNGFVVDPELRTFGGHWGLLGLRERAAQVGGRLTVRSVLDCGTAVVMRVPYAAAGSR